jgi:aspartate kinase
MIVQNVSSDGATTDMTFTAPPPIMSAPRTPSTKAAGRDRLCAARRRHRRGQGLGIGIGMRSHAGVAAEAFKALAEKNINIRAITTSEIKFSLLIDAAYTELAVRTLHTLYGFDRA